MSRLIVNSPSLGCERLFTASSEPVLVIESASACIVEANPAAAVALLTPLGALMGARLRSVFDERSRCALDDLLDAARAAGAASINVRVTQGGAALQLGLSLLKTESAEYFLVRLGCSRRTGRETTRSAAFQAIENAGDGFLVTDPEFRVDYANRAFVEMVRSRGVEEIRGIALTTWFALSGVQLAWLRRQLLQREATVHMRTRLRCSRHWGIEAELCAVAVPECGGQAPCWGFCVRQVARIH